MPSVVFPDVPDTAGVPPVNRQPGSSPTTVNPVSADSAQVQQQTPQWGIFLNGKPAFTGYYSVISIDYKANERIPTHPVEQGGFASYNKVAEPWDARVTMACDGSTPGQPPSAGSGDAARQAFLDSVDAAKKSLTLYSVVTPEVTYTNGNIVGYTLTRKSTNGRKLIVVDIMIQEVRIVAQFAFSNTASPEGADPVNSGAPQPQTPTPAQTPPAPVTTPAAAAVSTPPVATVNTASATNPTGSTAPPTWPTPTIVNEDAAPGVNAIPGVSF